MDVFFVLMKLNIRIVLQYKKSLAVSIISDPIVILMVSVCFKAIYSNIQDNEVLGYSLSQMIWYFAGATLIWFCVWNSVDSNISNKVLSGDLSVDLLKPVYLFNIEFVNALSSRLISFFIEFIPCAVIFGLIVFPDFITVYACIKFIVLSIGSFVLYFIINYIIGITSFYIKSNYSLQSLRIFLITLSSGAMIPLEFYPAVFRKILSVLPFQYMFYWPIQMLMNRDSVKGYIVFTKIIGMQFLWIVVLYFIGRLFWNRAIKKYCAAGG